MWRGFSIGLAVVGSFSLLANCGSDEGGSNSGGSSGTGGKGSTSTTSASGGLSSGSSSGGSAGAGGSCPGRVGDLNAELANAICDKRADCCPGDRRSDCLAEVLDALDFFPDLTDAEAAGSAELDCHAVDECLGAIEAAACEDWPFQTSDNDQFGAVPVNEPACYAMVQPKLEADARCRYNYECIHGLCLNASDDARGTCVEYVGLNHECGGDSGGSCDPASMFCNSGGKCQAYLPIGTSCTAHDQCETRLCDLEDTGECIAPGVDQCRFVPLSSAHCAFVPAPSEQGNGYVLLALMLLGGAAIRRKNA